MASNPHFELIDESPTNTNNHCSSSSLLNLTLDKIIVELSNEVLTFHSLTLFSELKISLKFDIFICYYLGQNKLLWVGGWLAEESNNKANISPAKLN